MDQRRSILSLFNGLRVADVRDGMDAVGWPHRGSLDPSLRPLWRTRAVGLARTARYLPYRGTVPSGSVEEYEEWSGWYYGHVCTYPWVDSLEEGDFVCLDLSGVTAGLMGSENTLSCIRRGAVGFVSSDGVRDTDEIILQQIPFWSRIVAQSMVQGRLQFYSMDQPIALGGVTVNPGDVIVADGDGVIAVPREIADAVGAFAQREQARDRAARRAHYQALGKALDDSVKQV
jgi:4-hydroxy-4-methyl-2-oxoglutarate aldolase